MQTSTGLNKVNIRQVRLVYTY